MFEKPIDAYTCICAAYTSLTSTHPILRPKSMTLGLPTTATQQYAEQNQSDATDTAEGIGHLGQLWTFDLPTAQQS